MDNHVHLIIKALKGKDLSDSMRRIGVMYSGYYRKKYGGSGHLFQGRFKSFLIEEGKYLFECGRYVELNPVSAGIVKNPLSYIWSSYTAYMGNEDNLVDISPEYLALANTGDRRIRLYKEYVETARTERRDEERFFREGFYGSEEYRKKLEETGLKPKWSHSGRPKSVTKKKK
jgi:putative transposase